MEVEETSEERHARYMDSEQGEVLDPDEWADRHFGRVDPNNYDNMVAQSNANQLRLANARSTLRDRCQAALHANWEEAAADGHSLVVSNQGMRQIR